MKLSVASALKHIPSKRASQDRKHTITDTYISLEILKPIVLKVHRQP